MATISPGPNFLFVSSTAMHLFRRAGIAAGLGVAAGTITWSVLTLSVLLSLTQFEREVIGERERGKIPPHKACGRAGMTIPTEFATYLAAGGS